MEIQLHATTSHLWFEELVSGDRNESIDAVYHHLDLAEHYADLMLNGGVQDSVRYFPLEDSGLRLQVHTVNTQLESFRRIMGQRWSMRSTSIAGTDIDQRFDEVYNQLVDETDALEVALQHLTDVAKQRFYINHLLLLGFAMVITFAVGWVVHRFLMRQAYHLHLLEEVNQNLASEVEKRRETEALLEQQATTDHLTGIFNRSRMSELLHDEWNRVTRYGEPFSLIMFDIDHFKQVNDTLGHHAGDRVLVELTQRVKLVLRESDIFARWGGEEFLLLLPETNLEGAEEVAERCRHAFSTTPVNGVGTVTASFGVVAYRDEDGSLEHLLQRADAALYEAKHGGRDRVSSAGDTDN
jgi:diguanylate cyclase (GGDEF)-like protein